MRPEIKDNPLKAVLNMLGDNYGEDLVIELTEQEAGMVAVGLAEYKGSFETIEDGEFLFGYPVKIVEEE